MKHEVIWIERGWQPVHIGFCPSRKAWRREMKRLGIKGEAYPESDGRAVTFDHKDGTVLVLVTVRDGSEKEHDQAEIAGIIAHEATHAWQRVRLTMGETEPSAEFEAYAMQAIFQGLYSAFLETRG